MDMATRPPRLRGAPAAAGTARHGPGEECWARHGGTARLRRCGAAATARNPGHGRGHAGGERCRPLGSRQAGTRRRAARREQCPRFLGRRCGVSTVGCGGAGVRGVGCERRADPGASGMSVPVLGGRGRGRGLHSAWCWGRPWRSAGAGAGVGAAGPRVAGPVQALPHGTAHSPHACREGATGIGDGSGGGGRRAKTQVTAGWRPGGGRAGAGIGGGGDGQLRGRVLA